jgi:hypothetical protein
VEVRHELRITAVPVVDHRGWSSDITHGSRTSTGARLAASIRQHVNAWLVSASGAAGTASGELHPSVSRGCDH